MRDFQKKEGSLVLCSKALKYQLYFFNKFDVSVFLGKGGAMGRVVVLQFLFEKQWGWRVLGDSKIGA